MKSSIFLLPAAFLMLSGAALADQAAATAPAKPAAASAAKKTAAVQSEKSKKCSQEADAKKLHGKARKAFRKTCMKTES